MNCSEVQESLSAFCDGELTNNFRAQVSKHLDECSECSRSLAAFRELSTMAASLNEPEPPDRIWREIADQLDQPTLYVRSQNRKWLVAKYLAIAATVLIAVGIGWYAIGPWSGHGGHEEFVAEFGRYVDDFHRDPVAAQQFLLAKYDGRPVTVDEAARHIGYRPVAADDLPEGFSLESTYVISMPCCREMENCSCVQSICRRADGSLIAIFQHGGGQAGSKPELFGDRPTTLAQCGGKACSLVHLNNRIAASWMRGERHIAVIGVRSIDEVDQLAAAFN